MMVTYATILLCITRAYDLILESHVVQGAGNNVDIYPSLSLDAINLSLRTLSRRICVRSMHPKSLLTCVFALDTPDYSP